MNDKYDPLNDDQTLPHQNPTKRIYGLRDILNFGKHKGKTVRRVIETDPEYLEWATDAIAWLELSDEAEEALEDAMYDFSNCDYGDGHDQSPLRD